MKRGNIKTWLAALTALVLLLAGCAAMAEEVFLPEEAEEELVFVPAEEEVWESVETAYSPFTIADGVLTAWDGRDAVVTVPAGVRAIGAGAFRGCTWLREVTLPEDVREIGAEAFAGCTGLARVTAPGVRAVGARAFQGCAALKETVFAEGAEIAVDAFGAPEPSAAPVITSQPSSKKVKEGGEVMFSVSASGATGYQWQYNAGSGWKDLYNGGAYTGPYTGTLRFTAKATLDGLKYRCAVKNASGTTYSNTVTFNLLRAPVITSQPSSKKIPLGDQVFFDVKATDAAKYRWQYSVGSGWSDLYNDSTYSGVTGGTLKFISKSTLNGRMFRCKITNDAGYVYSNVVTFTVASAAKPVFTSQPSSKTVAAGGTVTFTGKASGDPTYRWQYYTGSEWKNVYNDSTYSGVTTTTLKFTAKSTLSGRKYRLSATNAGGTAYSNTVTFTCSAGDKPKITSSPSSATVASGSAVTFQAGATGYTSLRWQSNSGSGWKDIYDDSTYSGTKTTQLKFTSKNTLNGRRYRLSATNAAGTVYSGEATFICKTLSLPTFNSAPVDQTVKAGQSSYMWAIAQGADTLNWQFNGNNGLGWRDLNNTAYYSGVNTEVLDILQTNTGMDGYRYRLKATNAAGTAYSQEATLHVYSLSLSKSDVTIVNGGGTSLEATTNGTVTWSSSNTKVAFVSSSGWVSGIYPGTATITATVGGKVSASCKVTVRANYRALLISESTFPNSQGKPASIQRNKGTVTAWMNILNRVHGPDGGAYNNIRVYDNLGNDAIFDAISSVLGVARDGDVSLFMISTHGNISSSTNEVAGRLSTYYNSGLGLPDLAKALAKVPGQVIVVLEACGSGAATQAFNGSGGAGSTDFARLAIRAFAEADPMLTVYEYAEQEPAEEGMIAVPEPETNEFRTSKFIILTAANYQEMSWGYEGTGAKNYLTEYCEDAIGTSGSIPADTQYGNGDGRLTMSELLSYLNNTLALRRFDDIDDKGNLLGSYYQHPQIYPSNSSYVLFIR